MSKIKVLYISHTPQIGGAEVCLQTLIRNLNRKWIEPVVIFPTEGPIKEKIESLGVKTYLSPLEWWIRDIRDFDLVGGSFRVCVQRIGEIIDAEKPDIVHSNTSVICEGAIAAKVKGVRHIWHVHEKLEGHPNLKAVLPFPLIYWAMDMLSDRIVVVSNATKGQFEDLISPDKVLTIYNGIDVDGFKGFDDSSSLRKELGLTDNSIIALTVGSIVKEKGYDILLDAASLMMKKGGNVKFLIAGGGRSEEVTSLLKKMEVMGLTNTVYYLGFREDIHNVIYNSDFLILPSHIEAFPVSILEAMASSKPAIVTDCGGPSEMVINGKNGFIVPVNDPESLCKKVLELASDSEKIKEMGKNAFRVFNGKFSADIYAGHFEDLYREIVTLGKPLSISRREEVLLKTFLEAYENSTVKIKDLANKSRQLTQKDSMIAEKDTFLAEKGALLAEKDLKIQALKNTLSWRITAPLRWLYNILTGVNCYARSYVYRFLHRLRSIISKAYEVCNVIMKYINIITNEGWPGFVNERRLGRLEKGFSDDPQYNLWISKNEPDMAQLKGMRLESRSWRYQPKISIITPVYNTNENDLTECLTSVLVQIYQNWELCLADGGSDRPYVKRIIKDFARKDHRVKYLLLTENKGIAGNSNEALKLASGEYVAFLDHDDLLAPFTLYEVAKLLNQDPSIDFVYSDEDKVPAEGRNRHGPYFKPDWSPDTFLSYNYICHFAVIRRKLVEEVGGFRKRYDYSQDYDLFLRVTERTNRILRIPKILYHWRAAQGSGASSPGAKPQACVAAKKAIQEHLNEKGVKAEVLDGLFLTSYRVKYRIRPSQKVCIIIPSRDKVHLLKKCVSSILNKTDYRDYEIIIVDNQSIEQETREYFITIKDDKRIKILQYDKPFNYSAINNFAARFTDADYLLFLNNDTEVIGHEWLTAMLEHAQRTEVGAVGAKLYYPNNTVQHAGDILGIGGLSDHSHLGFPRTSHGYFGRLNIIQNMSVVTGACMVMRREVFEEVGGFDEILSHVFNDVDLCLKIREKGYLILYTPYAELYHQESASRGYEDTTEKQARFWKEVEVVKSRWKHILEAGDPYYNPNLTLEKRDFSIKL